MLTASPSDFIDLRILHIIKLSLLLKKLFVVAVFLILMVRKLLLFKHYLQKMIPWFQVNLTDSSAAVVSILQQ